MILILTAAFGDGHNTAARCIADAARRLSPGEEVAVHDIVCETHPQLSDVLQRLYQFAITSWPASWLAVYRLLEKMKPSAGPPAWQLMMLNALAGMIETKKPRVIISTYPLYAELVARVGARTAVPPLVTVITDSISVHPFWVTVQSDLHCVADEETKAVVGRLGVDAHKIRVTGFPVSLAFMEPPAAEISSGNKRLLYLPSTSTRWVALTLEALRPLLRDGVHLTLPVGKHAPRLHHTLRRFLDSMPGASIDVIGWTDQMPRLLQTHDVLISKAGGAILHEVLAARCPVVIDYVVPGQEEGNADLLLSNSCALRSRSPSETAAHVAALLADDCKLGREFREKMIPLSVPDAAMQAARLALELAR
ncbi:MAG: hypothetical protein K1X78_19295 [Verrucomicrobiaceae bacterium]|nr:hypothetical protein [Verrucomicrobiaceae bacterium]